VRLDETDRQQAEQVFKSLGMNLATGINIYIKAVGRQQKIPFELDLSERATTGFRPDTKSSRALKEQAFNALDGVLAGHEVDLEEERAERISSK